MLQPLTEDRSSLANTERWQLSEGFLRRLTLSYSALWQRTPENLPPLGPPVDRSSQRSTAREAKTLVDELTSRLEFAPAREEDSETWRAELEDLLRDFGRRRLGWPEGYRDLLFAEEFFEVSRGFVRQARAFAPGMTISEIGQALRNVWIMNSIQMLLGLEVSFSPAIFAYSMLYPLTDNLLDNPEIPPEDKIRFNRRLGRRLVGEALSGSSIEEAHVFDLIGRIEEQFPRHGHASLYESLRAIHRAQVDSLRQDQPEEPLSDEDLLAVSLHKGGTSVLADAYLVAGELSRAEARFFFGYGAFLQLLDDLQDALPDRRAAHATLFSRAVDRRRPLDPETGRLYRFMHEVLGSAECFHGPRIPSVLDLIRRNCVFLLVGTVAENPRLFSSRFRHLLEGRWHFRFRSMRRLRKRARKKLEKASERLRKSRGVDSLLDLLVE